MITCSTVSISVDHEVNLRYINAYLEWAKNATSRIASKNASLEVMIKKNNLNNNDKEYKQYNELTQVRSNVLTIENELENLRDEITKRMREKEMKDKEKKKDEDKETKKEKDKEKEKEKDSEEDSEK